MQIVLGGGLVRGFNGAKGIGVVRDESRIYVSMERPPMSMIWSLPVDRPMNFRHQELQATASAAGIDGEQGECGSQWFLRREIAGLD